MKSADAVKFLDEIHKINQRGMFHPNAWTENFLTNVDFDARVGKKDLSPKQGAKLKEVYQQATEAEMK